MAIKERELEITLDVDWRIFSWNLKNEERNRVYNNIIYNGDHSLMLSFS